MNLCKWLVFAALLACLGGCVRTYRGEYYQKTTTTMGATGVTTESSGFEEAKQWRGPAALQPRAGQP